MAENYKTEQESFWAGEFGDEYVARNRGEVLVASNLHLFSLMLARAMKIKSVLEVGANIGLNLRALERLLPEADLAAVEINKNAVQELKDWGGAEVYHSSIFDFSSSRQWEFVFASGVLIHINPDMLPSVYNMMYKASNRYIGIVEYYNPTPVSIPYRGHDDRLFKRDFAGEMMDLFPDLKLIDYGFVYHRDSNFPMDDSNWFMLEKG
ncbi:MAG: pseudaminic acid biosynthesis-associated methylase [Proteobacteria bacterium]|nr:pseudaminic acid biosynthesis-associated methylase [Pseudomonadota bacterium]MBU1715795.1 pseudaminic acid biosynthesis-associated methylase [Pseudomonadota bacterium]